MTKNPAGIFTRKRPINKCSRLLIFVFVLVGFATPLRAQEVVVLSGLDDIIVWLEAENGWGADKLRAYIAAMRKSGELIGIVNRMRLE